MATYLGLRVRLRDGELLPTGRDRLRERERERERVELVLGAAAA